MLRKLFLLLAVGSVPILAFGSGKIHGKVIDASTSEALVGANVTVQGTSFGAVTNVSGEFVVLNLATATVVVGNKSEHIAVERAILAIGITGNV